MGSENRPLNRASSPRRDRLDRFMDWIYLGSWREQWPVALVVFVLLLVPAVAVDLFVPELGFLKRGLQIILMVLMMWGTILALILFLKRSIERLLLRYVSGPDALQRMSWRHLELLACELYRRMGYKVRHHSAMKEADGGLDIEVEKDGIRAVIQCKKFTTDAVGVDKVRELYGVMISTGAQQAILITSSHFSDDAERFAYGKPIELIEHAALWGMVEDARAELYVGDLVAPPVVWEDRKSPLCPRCGEPLLLKKSTRGWMLGCSAYGRTKCGTIVPLKQ